MRHRHTIDVAESPSPSRASDRDICDSYLYLLGRLLVLRQEHLDLNSAGFEWNRLLHRDVCEVAWAIPDPNIVCSEAWIAVDETSCTMIDIPRIADRYHTIQVLNLWGETIANINERTYPSHPSGSYAFCLRGAHVKLPYGSQRIDLPGRKARLLAHVALGSEPQQALSLQRMITMRPTGSPRVPPTIDIPLFTNDKLPGVEAFDTALALLATEQDGNPSMDAVQAKVRTIAVLARRAAERARIHRVIRDQAWGLRHASSALDIERNDWVASRVAGSYGDDWLARTASNLRAIWANAKTEVATFSIGNTLSLNGSDAYTMTFAADDLPSSHVTYFWSVTGVDSVELRPISSPNGRVALSSHAPLQRAGDGSLTLYFAPELPASAPESNWLPTPLEGNYMLTWRSYGPDAQTVAGDWFPPPLAKA